MCYHTKFRRYGSNRLGVGWRSQKFRSRWGPAALGWGRTCPPEAARYSPTCYHTPNFVTLGQTVWAKYRGSKHLGDAGPPIPWDGVWMTHRNTLYSLNVRHRTKIRRSRSNQLGAGRVSEIGGSWGLGIGACPLRTCYCPHVCYHSPTIQFVVLGETFWALIMEIHPKILTSWVPPFKVTQGNWIRHRSIGRLWLPITVPR